MPIPLEPWTTPRTRLDAPPGLVLGTMNFGKRTAEPEAARIVDAAFDHGLFHFDTANAYVDGEGERILGRLLRGRRSRAVITTKVGLLRLGGTASGLLQTGGTSEGLGRDRIVRACEESLSRLGTDYVDFYFLHVPDGATPIEETLEGMAALLAAGKVRAFGASNYASWQLLEMIHWCDAHATPRPAITQQLYNLLVRQLDVEYFAFATRYGLHTSVYNPLAGGVLAGRQRGGKPEAGSRFDANPMYQQRYLAGPLVERARDYEALARDAEMDAVELAYAWLSARRGVDSVLVGPGEVSHLEAAVHGIRRRLDADVIRRVDELRRRHEGTDATYARL